MLNTFILMNWYLYASAQILCHEFYDVNRFHNVYLFNTSPHNKFRLLRYNYSQIPTREICSETEIQLPQNNDQSHRE